MAFLGGDELNIYIYSDESGVFDMNHNDIFAFGGLIILGQDSKEEWSKRYAKAEKVLRGKKQVSRDYELKATKIKNSEKSQLFRSLNKCYKFGVVIKQKTVLSRIFESKKDKQRYLDFAYKIAIKRAFESLINKNIIKSDEVERLYFYVDEHTTATNGRYELREALEQEFKNGTYNFEYSCYFPPIFNSLKEVNLIFCNSQTKLLVRAADIVANRIYYLYSSDESKLNMIQNLNLIELRPERSIRHF